MTENHEFMENMEKSAEEHGHGRLGTYVGVTIAVLGVLLALSSALVGGERTELVKTMVEQSNTTTRYQSIATKHRILVAQLKQLHSLAPNAEKFKAWDDESKRLEKLVSSADLARIARMIRFENAKNLDAEIPTRDDLLQFSTSIKALDVEREAAKEWVEAYEPAIEAHSNGAEHYEMGQLAAEIGIVIASIALLFRNRYTWFASMLLGITAVAVASVTYLSTSRQLHAAESHVEKAKVTFEKLNSDAKAKTEDEELLKWVETVRSPVVEP